MADYMDSYPGGSVDGASASGMSHEPTEILTRHSLPFFSLMGVAVYLAVGTIVFALLADMNVVDALYFCMVTLTTVGYGDLTAHTPLTKLFSCFYIITGVAMVGAFLTNIIDTALDQQEALLLSMLKNRRAETTHQLTTPDPRKVNLIAGLSALLLLLTVGVVMFMVSGNLSFVDALYLTVVSSSTVGYGDLSPQTQATRAFAIFFLPLSTLILGKVISSIAKAKIEAKTKARQSRVLLATIAAKDYAAMDKDGDGRVSPIEFLSRTLVLQEKVKQRDIDEVMHRFEDLDKNGDGYVDFTEIGHGRNVDVNSPDNQA